MNTTKNSQVVMFSLSGVLEEFNSNKAVAIVLYNTSLSLLLNLIMRQLTIKPTTTAIPSSILPTMDDGVMLNAHEIECLDIVVRELYQVILRMHHQLNLYNDQGWIRYSKWDLIHNDLYFWISNAN